MNGFIYKEIMKFDLKKIDQYVALAKSLHVMTKTLYNWQDRQSVPKKYHDALRAVIEDRIAELGEMKNLFD